MDQIKQWHSENGIDKSIITDLTEYDSYGNLLTKKVTNGEKTWVETNEYSPDYSYGYLTKKTLKYVDSTDENIVLEEKALFQNTYYFNSGRVETTKDGKNNTTAYQYDAIGRITKVTHPDTKYIDINYGLPEQNIVTVTDENLHQFRNIYDGLGIIKNNQEFKDSTWVTTKEYNYNNLSQIGWTKDAALNLTEYQYDIFDRTTKIIFPNLEQYEILYYDAENKKLEINEEQDPHKFSYDNKGRLVQEDIIDGATIASTYYEYNNLDKQELVINANEKTTDYFYDDLGRLIKVTNPLNETTTYDYDNLDNLVTVTYPDGSSIQKDYNVLGKLKSEIDPSGSEIYQYDLAGNIETHLDKNNTITTYYFNSRNLLESKTALNETVSYTYDNVGNIETVTDSKGTIVYDYYDNNRLWKETLPNQKITEYDYYDDGNLKLIKDPFNLYVNYLYDNMNRLDTITLDNKTFDYDYYPDGMLKAIDYPILTNGQILREEFTYYDNNRLKTVKNILGTQVISQYSYNYDHQGNILSVVVDGQTSHYQYDDLDRLKSIDKSDGNKIGYRYDIRGNISQSEGSNIDLTNYKPGNLTFNQWNNLTQFSTDSSTNTYDYKPNGLRNKKVTLSGTTKYYLDNSGRVIAETDANDHLNAQMIWGHTALARKINNAYYYIYNGHGDVVQILDENGNIVNSYTYDEWGNHEEWKNSVLGIENPIRYAGEYYDDENGLYYLRARYYDPTIGRFILEDNNKGQLTNPLSQNLYTYTENNPVNYYDPDGNAKITIQERNANFTKWVWNRSVGKFDIPIKDFLIRWWNENKLIIEYSSSFVGLESGNGTIRNITKAADIVVRLKYVNEVRALSNFEKILVNEGKSIEEIARALNSARRQLVLNTKI